MLRLVSQPRTKIVQLVAIPLFLLGVVFISDLYTMRREVEYYYNKFEVSKTDLRDNIAVICGDNKEEGDVVNNTLGKKTKIRDYLATNKPDAVPGKPRCINLLEGDATSQEKAKLYTGFYPQHLPSLADFERDLQDCDSFMAARGYSDMPLSKEEEEFPIAYSISIHKDLGQAERLLRNIYQPQNHYCFHVDAKADPKLASTIKAMSRCLPNVFLVSKQENIVYASIKRLQAEINCMMDLVFGKPARKWRYFINLTGQAFPLKTNFELVKILKFYNGGNDIEGKPEWVSRSEYISKRWLNKWKVHNGMLENTKEPKDPPPRNISIIKGSAYGVFSREFVEYALTDDLAVQFLKWSEDAYSPDEFYWSTIHHKFINPMFHTPGGYSGAPERKPWLASYSAWHPVDTCHGEFIRSVCVFGVGDLPNLLSRKELFANKFYWNFQSLAVDCLEEWLHNKTLHRLPVDTQFYKSLPFIQKDIQYMPSKIPDKPLSPTPPITKRYVGTKRHVGPPTTPRVHKSI